MTRRIAFLAFLASSAALAQPAPPSGGGNCAKVSATCKAGKFSLVAGSQLCLNSTTCSSILKADATTLAPTLISGTANGSTAVGIILDTATAFSTTGAKILSIRTAGVEKLSIDKDGHILGTFATPQFIDMAFGSNGIKLATGSTAGGDIYLTDKDGQIFLHANKNQITAQSAENPVPVVHVAQTANPVAMEFGRGTASAGGVLAVTFATAFGSTPSCVCLDENAVPVACGITVAPNTTGVTFAVLAVRADSVDWQCIGAK